MHERYEKPYICRPLDGKHKNFIKMSSTGATDENEVNANNENCFRHLHDVGGRKKFFV